MCTHLCSFTIRYVVQSPGNQRSINSTALSKPCSACTTCSKRLDSLSLMEHNKEPFWYAYYNFKYSPLLSVCSKQCYTRNFGTIDLRQANLPHRDDRINTSPIRPTLTGSTARSHGTTSPTQEEIAVEGQFDRAKREQSPRKASGSPAFQTKVCS